MHKTKRRKAEIDSNLPLCVQCQKLDVEASVERSFQRYEQLRDQSREEICKVTDDGMYFFDDAILVHSFQDRLSKPSDCPLCIFFRSLRVQPELHQRHKLLAFRSSDSWLFRGDLLRENELARTYKDTVFLAVVPDIESLPGCAHVETWLDYEIPATGAIYCVQKGELSNGVEKKLLYAHCWIFVEVRTAKLVSDELLTIRSYEAFASSNAPRTHLSSKTSLGELHMRL
jgi:hypothetical protein